MIFTYNDVGQTWNDHTGAEMDYHGIFFKVCIHCESYYLQKTLPMLRAQGPMQSPLQALQQQQIPQSSTPQQILPQQQASPARQNSASPQPASLPQAAAKQPATQTPKVQLPQQVRIQQKIMLTPAQQQLIQRQQQLVNQRILVTGTSTAGQLVSTSRGLVMISQPSTSRVTVATAGRSPLVAAGTAAEKAKPKTFAGISR